jgi:hypothetical protein
MLGRFRGLRPRSDQKVFYLFAITLGVTSGWYSYHEIFAADVAAYNARKAAESANGKAK